GTLKFKNGDVYTGGFKDGHFEGRGTFKSHNGWTFTGIFHKGVANGAGKLQDKDHVIQAGNYVKGEYKDK
ncbi:MAG: membrane-binding protein, partial [Ligilactobacillus animalis]|nr:membrane-binding protein [Ligilactobacillus animalis]